MQKIFSTFTKHLLIITLGSFLCVASSTPTNTTTSNSLSAKLFLNKTTAKSSQNEDLHVIKLGTISQLKTLQIHLETFIDTVNKIHQDNRDSWEYKEFTVIITPSIPTLYHYLSETQQAEQKSLDKKQQLINEGITAVYSILKLFQKNSLYLTHDDYSNAATTAKNIVDCILIIDSIPSQEIQNTMATNRIESFVKLKESIILPYI